MMCWGPSQCMSPHCDLRSSKRLHPRSLQWVAILCSPPLQTPTCRWPEGCTNRTEANRQHTSCSREGAASRTKERAIAEAQQAIEGGLGVVTRVRVPVHIVTNSADVVMRVVALHGHILKP